MDQIEVLALRYNRVVSSKGIPMLLVHNLKESLWYNISPEAVRDLYFDEKTLNFRARIHGKIETLKVPYTNIINIIDRETKK